MSSIAIASAASALPRSISARMAGRHGGHKKSSELESLSESGIGSVGQMPVGASQGLIGSMLQSLQQVIGAQERALRRQPPRPRQPGSAGAANTATSAAATAASPTVAQEMNGFMHSLFQVLRQEGTAGTGAATTAAGSGTAAATRASVDTREVSPLRCKP